VYDISNKRRLGRSEVELVQDMYDGVKAMIESEKALAGSGAGEVGSHLDSPEDVVDFPVFPEGTKSLLSKFLTEEIWNELKDKEDPFG